MDCKGKKVIVTGGSQGYGKGIAAALKARGAQVWITGRRQDVLAQSAAEIGVQAVAGDVGKPADWDRIFAACGDDIDVLINNAGSGVHIAPLQEQSDDDIRRSIETNLLGVIYGCRRAAALMTARKSGLIINITSVCAHYGWPGFATYTAAKAGVDMFSRALYTELRPHNVRVTVLTPSWGETEFSVAAGLGPMAEAHRGRVMTGEQMGDLVVKICEFPDHLVFPEIMVQPVMQEIVPF